MKSSIANRRTGRSPLGPRPETPGRVSRALTVHTVLLNRLTHPRALRPQFTHLVPLRSRSQKSDHKSVDLAPSVAPARSVTVHFVHGTYPTSRLPLSNRLKRDRLTSDTSGPTVPGEWSRTAGAIGGTAEAGQDANPRLDAGSNRINIMKYTLMDGISHIRQREHNPRDASPGYAYNTKGTNTDRRANGQTSSRKSRSQRPSKPRWGGSQPMDAKVPPIPTSASVRHRTTQVQNQRASNLTGPWNPDPQSSVPVPDNTTLRDSGGAASGGPAQGMIYLDGNALGHWMTEHLGQLLARPDRGPSGIDPRVMSGWGSLSAAF